MIKDFESVKHQLKDLAAVINSFKSEAVQLRVVDLLFQRLGIKTEEPEPATSKPQHKRKTKKHRKKASKGTDNDTKKSRAKSGRPGPGAMVKQLQDEGFFRKPKTIQEIIDHCQQKWAYTYNANELAITMTRALRNQNLKRQKNEQSQFEYYE